MTLLGRFESCSVAVEEDHDNIRYHLAPGEIIDYGKFKSQHTESKTLTLSVINAVTKFLSRAPCRRFAGWVRNGDL